MEDGAELQIDANLNCQVCGERQFTLRDGFFYCQECGTKQEQVRAVEVEHDPDFNESKHMKKQKIQKPKVEETELTSWECYNYILRGLVEELIAFGAKEDLKLMTLQVWAAYLRRMEVAFFDRKNAELPRLGLRFLQNDARTLYSHGLETAKKRKRRRLDDSSLASGDTSGREWRKSKRKLDESVYSVYSSQRSNELSQSSANTSSTGNSTRAVQLKFSSHARKHLKKMMPVNHLKKHELDAEGLLKCHKLRPAANTIKPSELAIHTMNTKQLYSILAISLNLVEDDLQLSDLVRYIAEGHLSTKNVQQYFPENVAPHCKKILQKIQFHRNPDKYSDKILREHVSLLAKHLNIKAFNRPDILKLAERFITDLNLPPDIATYVERLINLLPPQMRTRVPHTYPAYEARAMAYIVFVLKLMFGLDGHKEKLISQSAAKVNQLIRHLSDSKRSSEDVVAPLFVWSEWVEFIEMRKVIVSHYNSNFCRQFKQCQSTSQFLEELNEEECQQYEQDKLAADKLTSSTAKVAEMQDVFKKFLQRHHSEEMDKVETMKFAPSFVPAHFYFKRILLYYSSSEKPNIKIPEFMRVDHTQRVLNPFMKAKLLQQFFSQYKWKLKVLRVPCTSRRCYVGVFRPPIDHLNFSLDKRINRTKKADYDISEEQWRNNIVDEELIEELEFKTKLDNYEKQYMKKLQADALKRKRFENTGMPDWLVANQKQLQQSAKITKLTKRQNLDAGEMVLLPPTNLCANALTHGENPNFDVLSLNSFDVFSEQNMEPINNLELEAPRRNLNSVELFANLSDDETTDNNVDLNDELIQERIRQNDKEECTATLVTSQMDCWLLLGSVHKLTTVQKNILESKFPRSFFWLLETCAQTIGVDWCVLYEQLLAIELMFVYGTEKLDDFKDCIHFKYNNPVKDLNILINLYREIW